jgi:hypothetical protein
MSPARRPAVDRARPAALEDFTLANRPRRLEADTCSERRCRESRSLPCARARSINWWTSVRRLSSRACSRWRRLRSAARRVVDEAFDCTGIGYPVLDEAIDPIVGFDLGNGGK